ncbi:MAG: ABC transporter permease, partial [Bacteroidota bacterium]
IGENYGWRSTFYIFGAIGLFIILIASINYMNLATAKSIRRAREIGIRKVAGAGKKQLILQFLGEAVIYSFLSLIIALIFIELFTPVFNDLSGKSLSLFHDTPGMSLWLTWLQVIVIVVLVGIFSGSFPAFILSGFRPVHVLKGASANAVIRTKFINTTWVRKALVVLQFTISVVMIISTWVVFSQLQHMRYRDLGFNKENIVVVNFPSDTALTAKREVIKNELLKNANISRVSTTNNLPGYTHGRLLFFVDEQGEWKNQTMNLFVVDDDFDDLLDLQVNEGRFFSRDFAHDDTAAFVVNEATVKFLGLEQPVGHKMKCGLGVNGKIVGVISNFHYASLQKPVEPLVLIYKSNWIDMLAIRVNMENFGETIQFIEEKWTAFDQKNAFSFSFLDANFDSQYDKERKLLNIFGYFAILIIIISSMGLFGLASFTAAQRTREIGIRKVLGSSETQITGQLIKDFLMLVLVAGIIAIPVSYFAMQLWLDAFAYRISLDWTFFAGSLLLAMAIAVFTVLFQALKAARSNPVDVLKYE